MSFTCHECLQDAGECRCIFEDVNEHAPFEPFAYFFVKRAHWNMYNWIGVDKYTKRISSSVVLYTWEEVRRLYGNSPCVYELP